MGNYVYEQLFDTSNGNKIYINQLAVLDPIILDIKELSKDGGYIAISSANFNINNYLSYEYSYAGGGAGDCFIKLIYTSISSNKEDNYYSDYNNSEYDYNLGSDYNNSEYDYSLGSEYYNNSEYGYDIGGSGIVFYYTTTDQKPLGLSGGSYNHKVIYNVYDVTTGGGSVMIEIDSAVESGSFGDIFDNEDRLVSIEIPNSITSIGDTAFFGCSSLTSVEIPNSVTSIGVSAFFGCSSLISIEIPNSVTSIGQSAFCGCNFRDIVIPDTYDNLYIGNTVFVDNNNLESIYLGSGVNEIGRYIVGTCTNLGTIIVSENNHRYDSRDNCNAIIETSTNKLKVGCKNTIIPTSVTSIGDNAFSYCSGLTSVEIPNSITSIGSSAFSRCSSLTSITSLIPAESLFVINSGVFYNVDKTVCTLYVPKGAKDTYSNTQGWEEFENIVELDE